MCIVNQNTVDLKNIYIIKYIYKKKYFFIYLFILGVVDTKVYFD